MSLGYGLNVKKGKGAPPPRRPVLDDEGDDDEEQEVSSGLAVSRNGAPKGKPSLAGKPPSRRRDGEAESRADLSSMGAAKAQVKAAEEVDASIFDYDSFHDAKETVNDARKATARQEAVERKPKYINNLLDAAARRKQDQLIAREKLLQREREAEGDEFADKEKFVTGAYKEQQVEARRLEKEEKRKAEEEDRRKRLGGGGMQGLYRSMMDQTEREHQEAVQAAEKLEREGGVKPEAAGKVQDDADTAVDLKAKGIHVNEDGQIIDKRELLSAGLNVGKGPEKRGAEHLKTSNRPAQPAYQRNMGGQQASRERQSAMMEEQLAERQKRAREEEDAERVKMENAAKTQKTDNDKMDAKARYLARKAAKERGEG